MSPRRSSALELTLALVLLFTDGPRDMSRTARVLHWAVSRPPSEVALVMLISNSPRCYTTRPHDQDRQLGVQKVHQQEGRDSPGLARLSLQACTGPLESPLSWIAEDVAVLGRPTTSTKGSRFGTARRYCCATVSV
jgi:hypothetical protein